MGVTSQRTITKTRRKTRDVDQIKADLLSSHHLSQFKDAKATEDLPDLGRNYCIECARWFDRESTLKTHRKGKPHKRRLKQIREELETNKLPGAKAVPPVQDGEAPKANQDVNMES